MFLLSGVPCAYGETPITGGFGLTLGAKFETNEIIVPWEQPGSEGLSIFKFEPENPSNIFTDFVVVTTQITRRICLIVASVEGPCREQFDALALVLVEKYGVPDEQAATWHKWYSKKSSNAMVLRCLDNELRTSYENLDICRSGISEVEADKKEKAKTKAKAEADNLFSGVASAEDKCSYEEGDGTRLYIKRVISGGSEMYRAKFCYAQDCRLIAKTMDEKELAEWYCK